MVPAWGAPPADQLLPATTKGFVSLPNVDDFRQRWGQTQLGKLAADPIMKPFADDLAASGARQVHQEQLQRVAQTGRTLPTRAAAN